MRAYLTKNPANTKEMSFILYLIFFVFIIGLFILLAVFGFVRRILGFGRRPKNFGNEPTQDQYENARSNRKEKILLKNEGEYVD